MERTNGEEAFEVWSDWGKWTDALAGDDGEDLHGVFSHVRATAKPKTRIAWERDQRTRDFCDLGLHLVYEQHSHSDSARSIADFRVFQELSRGHLITRAKEIIIDDKRLAGLTENRWQATWGYEKPFIEDLIAYMLRPGPTERRIVEVQNTLRDTAGELTLEEIIRKGSEAEIESCLRSPLLGLITIVESAVPSHPTVRKHINNERSKRITLWADLYGELFSRYGIRTRDGITWSDVAKIFGAVADGVLLRIRADKGYERLSNGRNVLGEAIMAIMPSVCTISAEEIKTRKMS